MDKERSHLFIVEYRHSWYWQNHFTVLRKIDFDPRRPVKNSSASIPITFELFIAQLIQINEVSQVSAERNKRRIKIAKMMETKLWLKQSWTDSFLRWKPAEFRNLSQIRIPAEKIWRPDIVLYNTAVGDFQAQQKTKAVIKNDGTVTWMPPAIFKSSCSIDVTYFPFDAQEREKSFYSNIIGRKRSLTSTSK